MKMTLPRDTDHEIEDILKYEYIGIYVGIKYKNVLSNITAERKGHTYGG